MYFSVRDSPALKQNARNFVPRMSKTIIPPQLPHRLAANLLPYKRINDI